MAEVAAFPHIDVAADELQRRVGTYPLHLLDGALEIEQRSYLDDAADGDDEKNADHQEDRILLERLMPDPDRHDVLIPRAGVPCGGRRWSPRHAGRSSRDCRP